MNQKIVPAGHACFVIDADVTEGRTGKMKIGTVMQAVQHTIAKCLKNALPLGWSQKPNVA